MAEDDPYGIDLAMTPDGDLVVWPNGALGVLNGPENCVQAMMMRAKTFPGEVPMHPTAGSQLPALVGTKLAAAALAGQARTELRRLVETDPRFLAVEAITATETTNGVVAVSATIELSAGERFTVSDLTDVRADDVSTVDNSTIGLIDGIEADALDDEPDTDDLPDFAAEDALLDDLTADTETEVF